MHIYVKRSLFVLGYIFIPVSMYLLFTSVLPKEITAVYDVNNLAAEQLVVQDQIEKDKLSQLPTPTEYVVDGKRLYEEFRKGDYTINLPAWYQDGKVMLNTAEKTVVAEARQMKDTFWITSYTPMSIGEHNYFIRRLGMMTILNYMFAIVFVAMRHVSKSASSRPIGVYLASPPAIVAILSFALLGFTYAITVIAINFVAVSLIYSCLLRVSWSDNLGSKRLNPLL